MRLRRAASSPAKAVPKLPLASSLSLPGVFGGERHLGRSGSGGADGEMNKRF